MTKNIYICGIGEKPAPSIEILHSEIPIDKTYILNNDAVEFKESEKIVIETMTSTKIKEVEKVLIDVYDFNGIVNKILEINLKESQKEQVKFHINFTSGTRIMSGAMVCASMMINAELCYVLNMEKNPNLNIEDGIVRIQPANLVEMKNMDNALLEVFLEIGKQGFLENKKLIKEGRKNNTVTFHTKRLVSMGLIENHSQGRSKEWHLTDKGKSTYTILSNSNQ